LLRLQPSPNDAEWCSVNRAVARLWAKGDPIFRARADTAARVAASASCLALP
jgi:hypothetical protein